MRLRLFIPGEPRGEPRTRAARSLSGRVMVYHDPSADRWKQQVQLAFALKRTAMITGPVAVSMEFISKSPKGPHGYYNTKKPDADNLAKAALDALTKAGAWEDDSQVACLIVTKRFAQTRLGEQAGAFIEFEELPQSMDPVFPASLAGSIGRGFSEGANDR